MRARLAVILISTSSPVQFYHLPSIPTHVHRWTIPQTRKRPPRSLRISSAVRAIPFLHTIFLSNTHHEEITTHAGEVKHVSNQLIGLAVQPSSARTMSGIETISAGWIICNSWAGIAATFALAITQGGPVTLIYGPIIMFVLVGACAATLAELASVYPTAGGQYHWTSILAPKGWSRGLVSDRVLVCCGIGADCVRRAIAVVQRMSLRGSLSALASLLFSRSLYWAWQYSGIRIMLLSHGMRSCSIRLRMCWCWCTIYISCAVACGCTTSLVSTISHCVAV